jgi:selenium metabolism protein YedF
MEKNQGNFVDARGLSCPQPVILTRRALSAGGDQVTTLVDSEVARDNIVKMATALSCSVEVDSREKDFYIHITKQENTAADLETLETLLVMATSESMGQGSEELGQLLIRNFFYTLSEQGGLGKVIIFLNGGVKLACEDSPALEHLFELEHSGAQIMACGTCLDYYKLRDRLAVGQVTNMYTIVENMQKIPKVLYL